MIAIADYKTGNLLSVANALGRVGAPFIVTCDPAQLCAASHVILPGVGEASSAMATLRESGLEDVIKGLKVPVLGICIGMQLMCRSSQEGDAQCMGIFDTHVTRFSPAPGLKIPHMGWDTVDDPRSALFEGLPSGTYFYYVHSYAPGLCVHTDATTSYGKIFSAALHNGNFYGTQFHPEKSGAAGERLLKNFLAL